MKSIKIVYLSSNDSELIDFVSECWNKKYRNKLLGLDIIKTQNNNKYLCSFYSHFSSSPETNSIKFTELNLIRFLEKNYIVKNQWMKQK